MIVLRKCVFCFAVSQDFAVVVLTVCWDTFKIVDRMQYIVGVGAVYILGALLTNITLVIAHLSLAL